MSSTSLSGTPIQKSQFFSFSGGLNSKDSEMTLNPDEASDLLNVDLGDRGTFKQRKGVKPMYSDTWDYAPQKEIWTRYQATPRTGGTFEVVVYKDGTWSIDHEIVEVRDATDTKIDDFVFETMPGFFQYNDVLYIHYTGHGILKYPVEVMPQNPEGSPYNVAKVVSGLPDSKFVIVHNNRAFYSDVTQPDRILWSVLNEVENLDQTVSSAYGETTITAGGVLDVHSRDIPITGFAVFLGALLIFKKDAVYSLTGYTPDTDWKMARLNITTGCAYPGMVAVGNNCVYYMGDDGIYRLTSPYEGFIETQPLSDKITPSLFRSNDSDPLYIEELSIHDMFFFKSKLYLLFYGYVYVFDELLSTWTKYDLDITCFDFDHNMDTIIFGGKKGYMLYLSDNIDDEYEPDVFTPITSSLTTSFFHLGAPEVTKKFKWLKLFFKPMAKEGSTIDVHIYIDNKDTLKSVDQSYTNMIWGEIEWGNMWGTKIDQFDKMIRFGGAGEYIKIKFTNDKLGESLQINGFTLGYKSKRKVR